MASSFNGPSRGEFALALAEIIRRDLALPDEERKAVRNVVAYQDDTYMRYQGCSCEYRVTQVKVFYETWDDEIKAYLIECDMGELITRLADIADEVEHDMW